MTIHDIVTGKVRTLTPEEIAEAQLNRKIVRENIVIVGGGLLCTGVIFFTGYVAGAFGWF